MAQNREQWAVGERAAFAYSLAPDANSEISNRLAGRTGQVVTVTSALDPDGIRDELRTLAERADAGHVLVYGVRFPDGHEDEAFEDELSEVQS